MDPILEMDITQDDDQSLTTTVYESKHCAWRPDLNDAELEEMKSNGSQAADRVRAFYTSGVPFFTKDAIADLVGQLDRARKDHQHGNARQGSIKSYNHMQKVSVQGLDGKTVELAHELGSVWPMGGSTEHVAVNFAINYNVYQHLIACNEDPDCYSPKLAYCPLRVHYRTRERYTDTKEFRPEVETKSLETTQLAFHEGVKAWQDSEECKKLTDALMTSTVPDKITKVVAFACGTMSRGRISQESITQHALILTIKDILQKKNATAGGEIKCYAQDPIYTDVDRAVLEGTGIHILEDPHGFLEVDDSSVVISFCPNVPVRQIVADVAHPALMIWNQVITEEWMEIIKSSSEKWKEMTFESFEELEGDKCDPESSRLREMVQNGYTEIQDMEGDALRVRGDGRVYVRQCSDT